MTLARAAGALCPLVFLAAVLLLPVLLRRNR
jgi:hypothetical protein